MMQPVSEKWTPDRRSGAMTAEPGMTIAAVTLESQLSPHPFAERWLGRDTRSDRPMLVYRLTGSSAALPLQVFLDAMHTVAHFKHRHALPLVRCEAQHPTGKWIASPYHAMHSGIITLDEVLKQRATGAVSRTESFWLSWHLIDLCAAGEIRGMEPGILTLDAITIDRRNAPIVELFGLGPLLGRLTLPACPLPSPRRSVEALTTLLLRAATGIDAPAVGALDRRRRSAMHSGLRSWFAKILDERTIETFTDARAALAEIAPKAVRPAPAANRFTGARITIVNSKDEPGPGSAPASGSALKTALAATR